MIQNNYHLYKVRLHNFKKLYLRLFSSYNTINKLKDPLPFNPDSNEKRNPSNKVIKLVDEILSLTLIEAADLCDLCYEKLAPSFSNGIPGRVPFFHPKGFFDQNTSNDVYSPSTTENNTKNINNSSDNTKKTNERVNLEQKIDSKPKTVNIRLVSYEPAKKVAVVKEVRGIVALGLKESKELVESCPKIIKKNVQIDEAEHIKKSIESAGGTVEFA